MNVYLCLECAQVQTAPTFPPSDGCKHLSSHRWRKLGEEGTQRYRCTRCRCMVNLNVQPMAVNCPTGFFHQWEKL